MAEAKTLQEKVDARDQNSPEKQTKPRGDYDPSDKEKPTQEAAPKAKAAPATPAVDPDADDPNLGLAERAARTKRRKAKAAGQAAGLK